MRDLKTPHLPISDGRYQTKDSAGARRARPALRQTGPYHAHGWHVPQLGPLMKTPFRSGPWHTDVLQEELPFKAM